MLLLGEVMRGLFDEVFQHVLLFQNEREYYRKTGLFAQLKRSETRFCDTFGGMHLLRFIVALSSIVTAADGVQADALELDQSAKQSSLSEGGTPMEFLLRENTIQGLKEVLRELENNYPLSQVC